MGPAELTTGVKRRAAELGFTLVGVCPAVSPAGVTRLDEWLAAGYAGQMRYLANRREAYADPGRVLEGVRSIVMLGMNYHTAGPAGAGPGEGRVSRYAWGDADYHEIIHARLEQLGAYLVRHSPIARVRGVVDTAPILEREFARLAGLGWIGKNTLLINRQVGSWFFLAALLTDVTLEYDTAFEADHCGSCRACLDACPTQAFPRPHVLDATRCISYLTIELRDQVPIELRHGMGEWVFGCDICQEVCPWNSKSPSSMEAGFVPRGEENPVDLIALFELDDAAFRRRFRQTPLWRARRRGLLRNAAIALGNRPLAGAVAALARGLSDEEPVVRGASAWALGRCETSPARVALETRLEEESDAEVLAEIRAAIGG